MLSKWLSAVLLLLTWNSVKPDIPPSFTREPQSSIGLAKGQEGGTITFYCTASGDSVIKYSWIATTLNGGEKSITSNPRYDSYPDGRLVISNLKHDQDDGYYHCVATNDAGGLISRRVLLRVAFLKTEQSGAKISQTAVQGQHWKYTFAVPQSFPRPKFIWNRYSSTLSETDRISISSHGNLYIAQLKSGDVAFYKSEVQNTITGKSYKRPDISLSVTGNSDTGAIKSVIILGPTHQAAIQGETTSITFECFASGRPMPSITWKKNGQTLSSNSKFIIKDYDKRLVVQNPVKGDTGVYSCSVSNPKSVGAGQRSANLTVHVPPTFTVKPQNIVVFLQKSITFFCKASGTPTPKISWYRNGKKVVPVHGGREEINAKDELIIKQTRQMDAGIFQCVATNDGGQVISQARLTLKGLPVWIDEPPKDVIALVNETTELRCVAMGDPQPTVKWTKNDVALDMSNSRFLQKSTGSLQIFRAVKSDSGRYTCTATNSNGKQNESATLRVLIKTVITTQLNSTTKATKALQQVLSCAVTKDPSVTVHFTWQKDKAKINNPRMTIRQDGSLVISSVRDTDAGTYVCTVKSIVGNDTTSTTLIVQETPLAPTQPTVSEIKSTSVRLKWSRPGYNGNSLIISYKIEAKAAGGVWTMNMDNINPSDRQQMSVIVRNLKPYTQYTFRVRAVNQVGDGIASDASGVITTQVAAPSQAPTNVVGTPSSADSILLQWKVPPPDSHNGPLRGFRVEHRLAGVSGSAYTSKTVDNPTATQLSIDGLVMFTEYSLRVQAYNDAGGGPYNTPVRVVTGEAAPSAPPQDVKVIQVMTSSVKLEWKPPPQKQWNGRLKGYKLQVWQPSTPNVIREQIVNHDSSNLMRQQGLLTGLKKFTQYQIVVVAFNSAGQSPKSDSILVKTEEGVPDAPTSFTVSEVYSDGLRVSWGQPAQVNGILVAYILKYWRNTSHPNTAQTVSIANETLSYVVTGLRPNTLYRVQVAAKTRVGMGSSKELDVRTVSSPVPPGAPSKPQVVEIKAWSVSLSWTPGFSGRAPIIEYTIEYNDDSFYQPEIARWKTLKKIKDAHQIYKLIPLEVGNLRPYTEYRFRLIAANKVGVSPPSNVSDVVRTQEAAPSLPPSELKVLSVGKDEVELSWKIPSRDSWNSFYIGFNITFDPKMSDQDILRTRIPNSQLNYYRVGGLVSFANYTIQVRTYNAKGDSSKAAIAYAFTKEDVPSLPPSRVSPLVKGSETIQLSWDPIPPRGRNGKILGYRIYYSIVDQPNTEKEEIVRSGGTRSILIRNLESYVMYSFTVLGYTKLGLGPRSSPVRERTAGSTPDPPAHVRFPNVNHNNVKVEWDPPAYPHGVVTGYSVEWRYDSSSSARLGYDGNLGPSARSKLIGSLSPRVYYRVIVKARTGHGWGSAAEQVVYTTGSTDPPDAPFILPIQYSDVQERSIKISWTAKSNPRSPIRYFSLQLSKNDGRWQDKPPSISAALRTLTVDGLDPAQSYRFRMMSTNDVGNSPFSPQSNKVNTRSTVPTGAPRDVRIRAASSTSLLVEWAAPLPEELGGTLRGFTLKYRMKAKGSTYRQENLGSDILQYTIKDLQVFTTYEVVMAAVNEKGEGSPTPPYLGTTGELPPSKAPSAVKRGIVTRTSVFLSWQAPPVESLNGHSHGFKVYFEDMDTRAKKRRRRRSRRASELCPRKVGPQFLSVPPHLVEANVTNLRKFTNYKIWVVAYNSKGDSPPSTAIQVQTASDIPGPPAVFRYDAAYNTRVDLSWEAPCEENGVISEYQLKYGKTSGLGRETISLAPNRLVYIMTGLDMLTQYSFQLRAKNEEGWGPPLTFVIKTKGPATLPGRPGKPTVQPYSTIAVVHWQNGDSGNIPFTKFEIQSKVSGQEYFETHWEALPEETGKAAQRSGNYTVGNIKPQTTYQFRIIAWNDLGASEPSLPSDKVTTGKPSPHDANAGARKEVYEQIWFIILMVLFVVVLVLLVVGFVCIYRRQRKNRAAEQERTTSVGTTSVHSTLEMIQPEAHRNRRVRNGAVPMEITYRDASNENNDEVSSLGSKEGLSDSEDSGVSEGNGTRIKRKSDLAFVGHYANDSTWRNSLGRQRPTGSRRLMEHTTEESDVIEELPSKVKTFKSFSSSSLNEEDEYPPVYAPSGRLAARSADQLNRIHRTDLPPEAVTSFMSPEYEARSRTLPLRDRSPQQRLPQQQRQRQLQPQQQRHLSPPRGSREELRDRRSPQSRGSPQIGGSQELEDRDRAGPRNSSFRKALFMGGPRESSDGSSRHSDLESSSGNEQRDTRNLVGPGRQPGRVQFDEEPGRRRARRPPRLKPINRNYPPSTPSPSSPVPLSPVSPVSAAPSYRSHDPLPADFSPAPSYHSQPSYQSHSSRDSAHDDHGKPPKVMYLDGYDDREAQISSYSSFV